jgi:excisionase family DNA binding protein
VTPDAQRAITAAAEAFARAVVEAVKAERPAATDAPDRLYGVEEAGRDVLGIGRTATYDLIARGALRSVKVGRRRLVAASDLAAYIEATRAR